MQQRALLLLAVVLAASSNASAQNFEALNATLANVDNEGRGRRI